MKQELILRCKDCNKEIDTLTKQRGKPLKRCKKCNREFYIMYQKRYYSITQAKQKKLTQWVMFSNVKSKKVLT